MAIFKVEGGHRLHGAITPQGAKNEALQILCATLLTPQRVVVRNIPRILDVMQLIELLRRMGVVVEQLAEDAYAFCARDIDFEYLQSDDYRQRCTRLRGSVMLIGPMLARFGVGYIPKPGSAAAGSTPISSDSRNSARNSTSTLPTSSSWSRAGSCGEPTCCWTKPR